MFIHTGRTCPPSFLAFVFMFSSFYLSPHPPTLFVTHSLSGAGFEALYTDLSRFHEAGFANVRQGGEPPLVPNPGQFNYRDGGEAHLNTPSNMVALQQAAKTNSRQAYQMYSNLVDQQTAKVKE